MPTKVKIVLDADVIIHFTKGGILHLLPDFLPDYGFIVLDIVHNEIPQILLSTLDNQIKRIGNIKVLKFGSTGCEIREFARLTSSSGPALGRGESACMVYCRYHNDVVGSSNIKDVADYCNEHGITFLTTNDFLFYEYNYLFSFATPAIVQSILSANTFLSKSAANFRQPVLHFS